MPYAIAHYRMYGFGNALWALIEERVALEKEEKWVIYSREKDEINKLIKIEWSNLKFSARWGVIRGKCSPPCM